MKTFIGNGYPRASAAAPRTRREPTDDGDTEKPTIAFLPYVAGISEKVCRDFNIKTVFKSTNFNVC